MAALRADLVFSYWIYLWYILYILKITKFSPKFPLILGLIHNIIMLLLMLMYGTSNVTIFYFIIINTLIKVVPLYYLRNEPITWRDIYFTGFLFIIFIGWLNINRQSLIGNIKIIHESLLYGKNKTPFMAILNNIKSNLKSLQVI
jgi:drug/metabolite transporter (DMT)-like permease